MMKIKDLNLKIVEKFKIFGAIALAVIVAGFAVMAFLGMNVGLDFAGGITMEMHVNENGVVDTAKLKEDIKDKITELSLDKKFDEPTYRWSDRNDGLVVEISIGYEYDGKKVEDENKFLFMVAGDPSDDEVRGLTDDIYDAMYDLAEDEFDDMVEIEKPIARIVNASTARKLLENAIIATIVAVVVMLIYIGIRFKLAPAIAAVIALCHDVLIMIALTTIFRIEVNTTFIAAIITIVGYSINATIVIFDRIREVRSLDSMKDKSDIEVANKSIVDTLGRTILTTITTLITIVALAVVCAVMGVSSIRDFALPIIFGLIGGTYSSVFISSSLWVLFRKLGNKILRRKAK